MRSFLLLLVFILSGTWLWAATVYYVHPDGTGSGMTWSDASADLASILIRAQTGDEIWVAAGTYTPTKDGDRYASFVVPDGVRVYAGFSGSETERYQRDWSKYPCILSGEIGEPGQGDNSYNVVFTQNVSSQTIVDGFLITAGYANGEVSKGGRTRGGGGWHDMAADGGVSKPVVSNCTFVGNRAMEGGAFYCNGEDGNSSPTFRNCRFLGNFAQLDGGAIFCDGRSESTNQVKLINCVFQDNMASYGAGIFVDNGFEDTGLTVEKCIFKKNNAVLWGGGIYYNFPVGGYFDFQMQDCQFEGNYPTDVNKNRFLSDADQGLAKR
ncbi:MAG: right-handed parallel beta-helix repeat-containing protein [Saprospirales bacterium]|nr:right-handed parallel beta-helix repeat-containing protein [Saprospirales bacterium]